MPSHLTSSSGNNTPLPAAGTPLGTIRVRTHSSPAPTVQARVCIYNPSQHVQTPLPATTLVATPLGTDRVCGHTF